MPENNKFYHCEYGVRHLFSTLDQRLRKETNDDFKFAAGLEAWELRSERKPPEISPSATLPLPVCAKSGGRFPPGYAIVSTWFERGPSYPRSAERVDFLQKIDVGSLLIQFAVLLFSLSIHEASHAWVADYFGDYTARYLGRVSLNPVAHIDPIGTVLFPLLNMLTGLPLIGWAKPVPINSVHLRNPRRDQIFISLAGPCSNLFVATTAFVMLATLKLTSTHADALVNHMVGTYAIPREQSVLAPILGMLFFALIINMALALFNFIPIPPLDGHWVLYGLLPYNAAQAFERIGSYGVFIIYGLMLLGAFRFIFIPIHTVLFFLLYI